MVVYTADGRNPPVLMQVGSICIVKQF